MTTRDILVLIPVVPVLPLMATSWLPWERWIPWARAPRLVLGLYLLYLGFAAWYFGFSQWLVAIPVVAALAVLAIPLVERYANRAEQKWPPE